MSVKRIIVIILVSLLCFGCQKKPVAEPSSSTQVAPVTEEKSNSADPAVSSELTVEGAAKAVEPAVTTVPAVSVANKTQPSVDFSFLKEIKNTDNATFHADAHKKYLDDKLDFTHYSQISSENTSDCYLVGSDFCTLYPRELLVFQDSDTEALLNPDFKGEGIPIPIGTILKATGTKKAIANKDKLDDWFDAFPFEGEYNYFYEVEYNGQTGLVFGADLGVTYRSSYENDDYWYDRHSSGEDRIAYYADLYKKGGILDYFSPLEGFKDIPENIQEHLINDRIVIQETDPDQRLQVDDMIDSYSGFNTYLPMFITTDLASHSQHLIFDRMLQYTEENYFIPRIKALCSSFIEAVRERSDVSEEIRNKAVSYFQIPELLLRTTPTITYVKDGWRSEKKYVEPDNLQDILQEYPEDVQADFNQIQEASGGESVIFGTREDFTQYKPRGHYTKNGFLKAYFKASMWFGRIHFAISEDDPEAEKMTPIAMFIVDTVHKKPELYKQWAEIFEPITALIGESDDLGFPDILPLWSEQKVDDFNGWTENKANFVNFMKTCKERLSPPALSSNTLLLGFDENAEPILLEKPPMGWRFLGQRYTLDADLFRQVSHPIVENRTCVRGLDIMRIFGAPVAEPFLTLQDYKEPTEESFFEGGLALKNAHDTLRSRVDKLDASYWDKTYYNTVLGTIRSQATFGQGAGFYFTECPMWNMKSLISSHATWAELKHDTILYAKQYYVEKGGGDDWAPTYRTKPLPNPSNYIEPNLSFWELSMKGTGKLISIYKSFGLMDDETARVLTSLMDMYSRIYDICNKEVADEAVSADDNYWIRTIPNLLADFVMIHQEKGNFGEIEQKDLQMACIADVFTSMDIKSCLEVGVGVPYKVYIPLNDCRGKRISVGYIPSYYEFYQPISNRLNDDEWKSMVYRPSSDISKYRPFWSKSCILPAK